MSARACSNVTSGRIRAATRKECEPRCSSCSSFANGTQTPVPFRGKSPPWRRPARPLSAWLRRRTALLDTRRGRRRRRERADRRGRGHRTAPRRAVDRALRARQRAAGHLGRCGDRPVAAGRRSAHPDRDLDQRRLGPGGHRLRRRDAGAGAAVRTVCPDQHLEPAPDPDAGPDGAAVPGQWALAVSGHPRRRRADRTDRLERRDPGAERRHPHQRARRARRPGGERVRCGGGPAEPACLRGASA